MRNLKFLGVSFLLAITAATSGTAQNPIIQTKYTADPAPMVYNDTVFLYTTHDEDDAEGFKMLVFLIKEMMIFIFPILCQVKTISIILFCRDGILILVFAQMEKVIISW